jgi:hypothetical protein
VAQFGVDPESVLLFRVGDEYLFSEYIETEAVFADLREYYNETEYRFEVPTDAFETVCGRLEDAYFSPVEVTDLEPYCVVVETYDEHAAILKQSVATWERRGHRFFLMESDLAVKDAVERGATRIEETDLVVGL